MTTYTLDHATRDEERQQVPSENEWCRRYAVHLLEGHAGIERHEAEKIARSAWRHKQEQYQNEPEAAAEIELIFWEE